MTDRQFVVEVTNNGYIVECLDAEGEHMKLVYTNLRSLFEALTELFGEDISNETV